MRNLEKFKRFSIENARNLKGGQEDGPVYDGGTLDEVVVKGKRNTDEVQAVINYVGYWWIDNVLMPIYYWL